MSEHDKPLKDGGAKESGASLRDRDSDPALQKENRQAVQNQSTVEPEDYQKRDHPRRGGRRGGHG
ncbi:hypothetical protein [Novosphingobium malaysiense]|uniref:Uncharacterized protein n=1 Tax=Novosphingobium malaysiense TaxID=1348853 RepID=A0A0B1ZU13_9SPHN|nr:hypothetical protein [Novosphingobium malaysiense]KHK92602.1 hypothetical protein LK12_07485 [Novosphingobium malaysiense]